MLSDDLTDVTSNDDESSMSNKPRAKKSLDFTGSGRRKSRKESKHGDSKRRSRKGEKRGSGDNTYENVEDVTDGSRNQKLRKSSRTQRTSETIEELSEEESAGSHKDGSSEAPPVPPHPESSPSPESSKERPRKLSKSRLSPFEGRNKGGSELDEAQRRALEELGRQSFDIENGRDWDHKGSKNTASTHVIPYSQPGYTPDNEKGVLDEKQKRALRELERLSLDDLSPNPGLSDASDDNSSYLFPTVPRNTTDFHGRTLFEEEQFNETLNEDGVELFATEVGVLNHSYTPSFEAQEHISREMLTNLEAGVSVEGDPNAYLEKIPRNRPISGETGLSRERVNNQRAEGQVLEQQRRLEELVLQQQEVYRQQVEQQQSQQHQQQQEHLRQQCQLQEQLRSLERMQKDWQQVAAERSGGGIPREGDVRLQKELVQHQQEIIRQQKEQMKEHQQQQEQLLKQQERLSNEIKQLGEYTTNSTRTSFSVSVREKPCGPDRHLSDKMSQCFA